MARGLTAKDLEMIDELAAFAVENDRNAELLEVMVKLAIIMKIPGASAVFAKRRKELEREAKRVAKAAPTPHG